jgi:hypothetical protein
LADKNIGVQSEHLNLQLSDDLSKEFEQFLNDATMLDSCASAHNANNNDIATIEA